jgi:hypothetical protein
MGQGESRAALGRRHHSTAASLHPTTLVASCTMLSDESHPTVQAVLQDKQLNGIRTSASQRQEALACPTAHLSN